MEKTVTELKKDFMKAYRWCRRAQEACLFKQVDIDVTLGFCEANYYEKNINAWTVCVSIWDSNAKSHIKAEWVAWRPEDFEKEKQAVVAYLMAKGVTVK